ncbi:MAG: phosphonate C-P lyase system protein PhnH [Betaproteobacteria bacterium HGW-Betaproteobacteria-15]|nr:MAG: phosphonate C-P lyase system protein PhnH [Betaproteobacteria bacterium HGW-Betaproteobacteria-15]
MNETLMAASPADAALSIWQPSRQQTAFRQLMTAFSYPGRVVSLASQGESALMLVLATLVDSACALADPQHALSGDDLRRLGVRSASVEAAEFVLADGNRLLEATPRLGSLENPEQGATVVMRVSRFGEDAHLRLTGPGIKHEQVLQVGGIDPGWWKQRAEWNAHFPLGVDLILVSGREVAVLPRTTHITFKGAH